MEERHRRRKIALWRRGHQDMICKVVQKEIRLRPRPWSKTFYGGCAGRCSSDHSRHVFQSKWRPISRIISQLVPISRPISRMPLFFLQKDLLSFQRRRKEMFWRVCRFRKVASRARSGVLTVIGGKRRSTPLKKRRLCPPFRGAGASGQLLLHRRKIFFLDIETQTQKFSLGVLLVLWTPQIHLRVCMTKANIREPELPLGLFSGRGNLVPWCWVCRKTKLQKKHRWEAKLPWGGWVHSLADIVSLAPLLCGSLVTTWLYCILLAQYRGPRPLCQHHAERNVAKVWKLPDRSGAFKQCQPGCWCYSPCLFDLPSVFWRRCNYFCRTAV